MSPNERNEGVPFISSDFILGSNKTQGPKYQSDINNTWGITPRPNRKRIWNERAIDGDEKAIDGENERGKIPMNSMGYRME